MTSLDALRGAARRFPPRRGPSGAGPVRHMPPRLAVSWTPTQDVSAAARVAAWICGGLAGIAVWFVLFALLLSGVVEGHSQHALYEQFRQELAAGTAPLGGPVAEGAPVAMLQSPAGGLNNLVVVQGTSSTALRSGPGHYPGAPLPGQPGVSVVMGRSTTFGGPFGGITSLSPGQRIDVMTAQGVFHYDVEDVRRAGDPYPPALESGSQLTLVTSEGAGWRSGWAPSRAVYVDALLHGKTVPAPATAGVATSADGVLAGDSRGLYPLILWLQLLLAAVVGGVWAHRRWGLRQSWIAVVPIVFTALWGASTSVWQLLPNLM